MATITTTPADLSADAIVTSNNNGVNSVKYSAAVDSNSAVIDSLSAYGVTVDTIDSHVNDKKQRNDELQEKRFNTLRGAQFDTYQAKRYYEHSRVITTFIISIVCIIIVLTVRNIGFISTDVSAAIIGGISVISGIVLIYQIIDIMSRDNMDYDSYAWSFNPNNQEQTVYQYDKAQMGKMFGTQIGSITGSTNSSSLGAGGCRNEECCGEGQNYDSATKKCRVNEEGFVDYNNLSQYTSLGVRSRPVIIDTVSLKLPQTPVTPHIFHSDCAECVKY